VDRRLIGPLFNLDIVSLNSIIELSPSGIIALNSESIVVSINPAALQMLKLNNAEHIGISREALEHEINKKCLHKMRHDGDINSSIFITINETPLIIKRLIKTNPQSSIAYEVHYFHDITHETNVSEMKTELLYTAAHELRTSLSSIQGYTELLAKRSKDQESSEFLEIILRQSNRLNNMINQILDEGRSDAARILELNTEKLEINLFITQIAQDFFAEHPFVVNQFMRPIYVDADHTKLGQAILNIFSNAKKYSADTSPITINILLDTDSHMAGIQVEDKGIGMTPVQQSQLFTRFYRANPEGDIVGTGLGLCLVKEILALHCGGVEVQSKKDKGTQVTLWLPTTDDSALH
jgi:signal transduction histidine kinase